MKVEKTIHIAYFITSHGFGHASRSAAIMSAIKRQIPDIHFDIFTRTPVWFFDNGLKDYISYHEVQADIGIVQSSPLIEDIPETLRYLDNFFPFSEETLEELSSCLIRQNCRLVLCDISPLGITAAQKAGIPSVLIENFTWDWIYESHLSEFPRFKIHIDTFKNIYASVDIHIQTKPVCNKKEDCFLFASPISRPTKQSPAEIREALNIPKNSRQILITMGGIPDGHRFLSRLPYQEDLYFVIPGASEVAHKEKNRVLLPHHSNFHHPDLIHASDAIIGKAGYSTIAEAYHAGVPFGYVTRKNFRESASLSEFIRHNMQGIEIKDSGFDSGEWIERLPELLALPHIERKEENGAEQIASAIRNRLLW